MFGESVLEGLRSVVRGRLLFEEPLAPYTTFGIGGPADAFIEPADRADLVTAVRWLLEKGIPYYPLGNGSNLLVSDKGIRGAVIRVKTGLQRLTFEDTRATAEAGVSLPFLVKECASRGLAGLVGVVGVPATVGGAVTMNAGTSLGEISDRLVWAEALDATGRERRLAREEIGFGYRTSRFQGSGEVLLAACFDLERADAAELQRQVLALHARRKATQPLTEPSAGCVWRNPDCGSAGRLIEEAGLKGLREGDAEVSRTHANFIVNRGSARAEDVRRLMDRVAHEVRLRLGVELVPELRLVGDWS